MKALLNKYLLATLFICSMFLVSCDDDNSIDVPIRDTDKLSFAYTQDTKKFTVRADGQWTVSADQPWLSFSATSGSGDGKTLEWIQVTAEDNQDVERIAKISIKLGDKISEIEVTQADGRIELGTPSIQGKLLYNESLEDVYLLIPYKKSRGTEKATTDITITGMDGITVENLSDVELLSGSNNISVPLAGIPPKMGDVNFTIKVNIDGREFDPIKFTATVVSENIILSQSFDLMVWGGDYINQKAGVKSNKGNSALPSDSGDAIASCTANTDGTNNLFGTALRPNFIDGDERGLAGWNGWGVFERPGYIKFGTGSYGGWLATPPLTFKLKPGEETRNLYVSFDYCRWHEEPKITTPFKVEGSGVASITSLSGDENYTWKRYTIKISNAKNGDIIVWGDNSAGAANNTTLGGNRYLLDNIEIMVE